jgi:hypothetical protein
VKVFGGRLASVMVVVGESVSVACSCEDGGSKMGVTGSRLGGKVGGRRRSQGTRTTVLA